jgi:hypothetical protein
MPRWITVRTPFNYHGPDRSAVTHFKDPGDQFVKDEVADFAVAKGYATEGKVDGSSRSRKGTGKRRPGPRKEPQAAKAPNHGSDGDMARQDNADHDRSVAGGVVDPDAG